MFQLVLNLEHFRIHKKIRLQVSHGAYFHRAIIDSEVTIATTANIIAIIIYIARIFII